MMDRTITNAWNGEDYVGNYGWVARWARETDDTGTDFYVLDPHGFVEWSANVGPEAPDVVVRTMWKATKNAADSRIKLKASAG